MCAIAFSLNLLNLVLNLIVLPNATQTFQKLPLEEHAKRPKVLKLSVFSMAPQVGLEPTTLRLTAECSAIELLRNKIPAATYSPGPCPAKYHRR